MRTKIRRFLLANLGLLCLVGVVVIWVVSGELIEFIFVAQSFSSPFFLTYFNTSLFSLYLLGFLFRPAWWAPHAPPRWFFWMCCKVRHHVDATDLPPGATVSTTTTLLEAQAVIKKKEAEEEKDRDDHDDDDDDDNNGKSAVSHPEMYSLRKVMLIALGFCPLWFGANYLYNLSLSHTSVASATILSSTSSLFTFCLAFLLKVEKATLVKLVGILLTLGGVVLVSLVDTGNASSSSTSSSGSSILGDAMALAGAIAYAGYAIYLRVRIEDERCMHMPMFFGFVGLFNICLLWPLGFILNYTHVEPFQWPKGMTLLFLFVNGIVGTVISDYLWVLAVLLTSPVIATVGLSLTIPLSMIADAVFQKSSFSVFYIVGAVLAVVGFILVNVSSPSEAFQWLKNKLDCRRGCRRRENESLN